MSVEWNILRTILVPAEAKPKSQVSIKTEGFKENPNLPNSNMCYVASIQLH